MKNIIMPKCPYCHKEYKLKGIFDDALSGLHGQYCSNTVSILCECGKEYYVSVQQRFIARRNK